TLVTTTEPEESRSPSPLALRPGVRAVSECSLPPLSPSMRSTPDNVPAPSSPCSQLFAEAAAAREKADEDIIATYGNSPSHPSTP
ncbi:MAG TPA: hypothetical protein VD770_03015, partial [Coxiellaceae bacterium]|nr:hypothetical protein [Coxiellaceae bacterium]